MFCGNCGNELPEGVRFCGECGAPIQETEIPQAADQDTEILVPPQLQEPNIKNGQPLPPAFPKKSGSKKLWIALGSGIAVIAAAVLGVTLLTSVLQENKDKKNARLYKEYAENLENANQEASEKIMKSLGGAASEEKEDQEKTETEEEKEAEKKTEAQAEGDTDAKDEKKNLKEDSTPKPTATPTSTPTEHEYVYVIKDCTWTEAQAECEAMGGYLVHFDTDGEVEKVIEDFTAQGFADNSKFWIGGARDAGSDSRDYRWVNQDGSYKDGSINADNYWMENEPSYEDTSLGVQEDKMILYKLRNTTGQWVFNDCPDNIIKHIPKYKGTVGFICEIEG